MPFLVLGALAARKEQQNRAADHPEGAEPKPVSFVHDVP